ncbi:protein MAIN-LIKE 1-like [Arachis stenosperma]|uniref:protein MAIN-LIKE 1-like n=1 Tax=Arachis stenosperma TaxID=217475 RepID=UPI0025AC844E|nr:protein MAIN-LIKE 1-like [Arachis stenosperma]
MPLDLEDNGLMQYARCYMLYLLGAVLLPDKANNTVHVRYLPLLADFDAICTYSWGSAILCWLYRAMCLATEYSVEGMAGCHTLLMSWIYYRLPFFAPNVTTPYSFPLATRWAGKKGQNDYAEQRLLRHRLSLFGNRTWTHRSLQHLYTNSRISMHHGEYVLADDIAI